MMNKICFLKKIQIFQYIYLNYFSKNVIRHGKGKIIPFKNAILDFEVNSKIILYDNNLEIGTNKLKHSKAETYVRLRKKAIWEVKGGADISYGSTIEILYHAKFITDFFTMNSFSVIVCAKSIKLGKDVMIGRNVTIYDSDFHKIQKDTSTESTCQEIIIGNHVWIASNVTVLKGVTVSDGSILGNCSLINKNIDVNQLVTSNITQVVRGENVSWNK